MGVALTHCCAVDVTERKPPSVDVGVENVCAATGDETKRISYASAPKAEDEFMLVEAHIHQLFGLRHRLRQVLEKQGSAVTLSGVVPCVNSRGSEIDCGPIMAILSEMVMGKQVELVYTQFRSRLKAALQDVDIDKHVQKMILEVLVTEAQNVSKRLSTQSEIRLDSERPMAETDRPQEKDCIEEEQQIPLLVADVRHVDEKTSSSTSLADGSDKPPRPLSVCSVVISPCVTAGDSDRNNKSVGTPLGCVPRRCICDCFTIVSSRVSTASRSRHKGDR
eukprot:TRINITY_DN57196_c0_g1_i1.p1 TRINITY_DN57196_c0_g1~~TRINITY_DN57196_c0_g1_i1.p1  ORF type:complete len:278 (+),score=33.88 TRINITY_DN57196_c0_g1_i1:73-906(+)